MKHDKVKTNPSGQSSNSPNNSPATPQTPTKTIIRDDTNLANTFKELLSGPPAAKRSLFENSDASDDSMRDAEGVSAAPYTPGGTQ